VRRGGTGGRLHDKSVGLEKKSGKIGRARMERTKEKNRKNMSPEGFEGSPWGGRLCLQGKNTRIGGGGYKEAACGVEKGMGIVKEKVGGGKRKADRETKVEEDQGRAPTDLRTRKKIY